jgi:aspartyl-tRNA(Asn)/glutamyl-tRNA(Gln) amidotransferase subunit A
MDGVRFGHSAREAKTVMEQYFRARGEGFGAEVKRRIMIGTYALSSGYYDAYYLKAQKVRTLIKQDFDAAFSQCDAIVCGTSPTVAFPLGAKTQDPLAMYLNDVLTIPADLAGVPAVSIPCGFSDGLPVGLQVIGPSWREDLVFRVAAAYELLNDWGSRIPTAVADAA